MHDKTIYTLPDGSKSFDPLSVRRSLLIASGNQFNTWLEVRAASPDDVEGLTAEENLVAVTRRVFGLPPATEPNGVFDATVLEYLGHYLEWLSAPLSMSTEPSPSRRPCSGCRQSHLLSVPSAV